ncbi:hypothetical protein CC86DRAFT_99967 [Ophiobolus disseminans]|uniref:Uncharacterized protein n=1 Tax=Ophiobolus disseminans TaxID=1469910 RepID=A0A6A6ZKW1_9PLEO|nr:hypothetical protein CC86DRAFT_99967 [Ophiobolus disseminans]
MLLCSRSLAVDPLVPPTTSTRLWEECHSRPKKKIPMTDFQVTGALLCQHLTDVEELNLNLIDRELEDDDPILALYSMSKLFIAFDPSTAHLQPIYGLQKLRYLEWQADEFHWAFAKPPNCQPGTSVHMVHCGLYLHVTLSHLLTHLGCVYNRSP